MHNNQDYRLVAQKRATNNPKNPWTEVTDHVMSLDMAKQIAMIQRNEKGKQAREYFLQVEKAWNSPELVFARALQMANKKLELQKTVIAEQKVVIEEKNKMLEEAKPKVVFADAVSDARNAKLIENNKACP